MADTFDDDDDIIDFDDSGFDPDAFDGTVEANRREIDLEIIQAELARLALLPELEYQLEREPAGKRLGLNLKVLDKEVKARRPKKAAKQEPAFDPDKLAGSASHIIRHPDILSLFAKDFAKVIAGETVNGKLLYLIGTSRLFAKPMNAAIKGTSAGGKSEIRKRILNFFPAEDVVSFTSLSEKALIYYEGDFSHKILSMGEAVAADEQSFQDYLLRELMSEGCIRHRSVQKIGSEIVPVAVEKQGPVAFLVTTTKNKLHAENETRMLSLEIDDSENQTRKVLDKVAQAALHDLASVDYKPWQDFQRWLAAGDRVVVVPYAAEMVDLIPPVAVRLRRDVGQIIAAIQAHALLHRDQRDRDEAGRIVADIEHDYDAVRKLMNAIVAEGSGVAVNPAMTETIEAVAKATLGLSQDEGANSKDIAKLLKLDQSATWRRLSAACSDGYVCNLEQRRRMPGKYRTTGQKIEPVAILPLTDDLAERRAPYTPQKSTHSCIRDEISDTSQSDTVCKEGMHTNANGDTVCEGMHTNANGLAYDNPVNGNGKSPPYARVHDFSGGSGARATEGYPPVCQHCGSVSTPINPVSTCAVQGETHLLHKACWIDWLNAVSS